MNRAERQTAEAWLRKAVRNAPDPLPPGVFPRLLDEAVRIGFSRSVLDDVLDLWLSYGYCRITDHITNDIELLPASAAVFGRSGPASRTLSRREDFFTPET